MTQSWDPNEMAGPLGFGGDTRYVLPGQTLEYTVYFENKDTAEAAAQQITIDADLSEHLDWTTFQFGELVLANQSMEDFSGKKSGKATISLKGRSDSIKAELTFAQGHLKLYMRSYDATQAENDYWPADAYDGFLKPNDDTGRGEGHFTYSIAVKSAEALADKAGAVIAASADIKFDENAIIPTDPAWYNTVYSEAPVAVSETDVKADTPVAVATTYVSWTDGGGATSYDVTFWQLDAQGEAVASWTVTGLLTPTCTLPMALAGNTRYRWQITSRNQFGSSKSAAMEFTTEVTEIAAEITAVSASARWPWNGLVDITYTIEGGGDKLSATVGLKGYDGDRDQTVDITSVTGPGADAPVTAAGTYTITWDASTDNAGNSSAFEITLTATTAAAQEDAAKLTATSAAFRLETRESFGGLLATGVEYFSPTAGGVIGTLTIDGQPFSAWCAAESFWDSTAVADGLHTVVLTESGATTTATLSVLNSTAVVHGGTLEEDETWGADRVHVIRNWVRIPAGKTLVIASGAIVKFCEDTGFVTEGTLSARGVVFTSMSDDWTGGDTGLNGTDSLTKMVYGFEGAGSMDLEGSTMLWCKRLPLRATNLSVSGDADLAHGGTATMTCWADFGTAGNVTFMPQWSITAGGDYATISSLGVLTNTNDTYVAQTVTVGARCEQIIDGVYGVWTADKTVAVAGRPVELTGIGIVGDASIAYGETASYICKASYNDDSVADVEAVWSLLANDFATLAENRVSNGNETVDPQTVTLSASYGGMTASLDVVLGCRDVSLAEALDNDLDWSSVGAAWRVQGSTTHDGVDAAVSGKVDDGESSVLETVVAGSGVLAFYWKVSSKAGVLKLRIDGVDTALSLSGEVDWTAASYGIARRGLHTVAFVYAKDKAVTADDESATAGDDCGWVDQVSWLPPLKSIAISGPSEIAVGTEAALGCVATFRDLTTQMVVPVWSLLKSEKNATISADGILTNTNATYADKSVAVTAQFGGHKVTRRITMAGKENFVAGLEISGRKEVATGATGAFSCKAVYADGKRRRITPVWSCESPVASVNAATGKVTNLNATFDDAVVVLKATWGTLVGTCQLTLAGQPPTVTALAIVGSDSVDNGAQETYACVGTCADGKTRNVKATWSRTPIKCSLLASKTGVVTNKNRFASDLTVTLTATYGGLAAHKTITLNGRNSQTRGGGAQDDAVTFDVAAIPAAGTSMSFTLAATADGEDGVVAGEDLPLSAVCGADGFAWLESDGGSRLAYETRQLGMEPVEWTLVVEVSEGKPVSIVWNLSDVPSDRRITVSDGTARWNLAELPQLELAEPGVHRLVFRVEE